MNERVQELAAQANAGLDGAIPLGFAEKFAELLIRECARAVDRVYETAPPDYGCMDWATWAYGSDVLDHFGIKDE